MDNRLKKSLEILKERARRLKQLRGQGGSHPMGETIAARVPPLEDAAEGEWERIKGWGGTPLALEDVAPGEERRGGSGTCYLIRPLTRIPDDEFLRETDRLTDVLSSPGVLASVFPEDPHLADGRASLDPGRTCFLDIETAGLTPNTYIFLCGLMTFTDKGRAVEQYFARDYSEEKALLVALDRRLQEFEYVVTYNGIAFDIPFIRTRAAVNRIQFEERFRTLDLLRPARRAYSGMLPNCKLETIERHLRGASRSGDIPGRFVPRVYHDFVRTGNARLLGGVLYHNQMDLFAMMVLLNSLPYSV